MSGLVDFNDVSYDSHADLLYDLAGQVVKHLSSYLPDEHETRKVLSCYQRDIARFVQFQIYYKSGADHPEYHLDLFAHPRIAAHRA